MRDLAITVLVALLIVFAGIRFSGYQGKVSSGGVQESATVSGAITATSTPLSATSTTVHDMDSKNSSSMTTGLPDKEPVMDLSGGSAASLQVADQKAGMTVLLTSVFVPEGSYWVAVHEGARTLGARLFAKGKGSGEIELLRATEAGKTYTVVLHKDDGDRQYARVKDLEVRDATGKEIGVSFKAL